MNVTHSATPQYLLIGDGRVARHFKHYFDRLQIPFQTWCRQNPLSELGQLAASASHILLLISDRAIESFIQEHLMASPALRVHVSGSLVSELAYGAHPLMTFSHTVYSLEDYQQIPFILDDNAPDFAELLPGLPNAHFHLSRALKPKYHALCVMSGNFSCLLWNKLLHSLATEFHLPPEVAHPYLQRQTQNLLTDAKTALTGPLVRGDAKTIANNLAALSHDPFQDLYESFLACYQQSKGIFE